jgi:hypothetical protein
MARALKYTVETPWRGEYFSCCRGAESNLAVSSPESEYVGVLVD